MQSPDFPELPYYQALGDGGPRSVTQMVVIHATDNTASALNEAEYATHRTDDVSAHFYSDENSIYQALHLDHIAWGCFSEGNHRSVQFELVGLSNHLTDATMRKIAPYVAKVCERYGLPIRHVSSSDLVNGAKGICGHGDVTNAWHQGDHTDPGSSFPWDTFIGYVAAAAGQAPAPTPQPTGGAALVVDGEMGFHTVSALQRHYGTVEDGVITQPPGRSSLVMAMQHDFNNRGIRDANGNSLAVDGVGLIQDGHTHYHTIEALERHMGGTMDGVLDYPVSGTVKRMQERLNNGTF